MASSSQILAPPPVADPLALWHLLSLDAPTVAALWTCFVARAHHIQLPMALPAAIFLAVWLVYATDRLLDTGALPFARRKPSSVMGDVEFEARHLFHFAHRRAFFAAMPFAAMGVLALLPRLLPSTIRFYFAGTVLLLAWFVIIHLAPSRAPKELVVGLFFAATTFAPAVVRYPDATPYLPEAALFAALCTLNCLLIHAWQRPTPGGVYLPLFAALLALISCALAADSAIAVPVAGSAALLLALHSSRHRLSRTHLRCAADLALLTPALLLPLMR